MMGKVLMRKEKGHTDCKAHSLGQHDWLIYLEVHFHKNM